MPVDFGLLQPAQPVSAFFQGQQDIRAEADRNALRQMQAQQMAAQQENLLAQRQEREAHAAERRAKDARAVQRQQFLTGAAEALAKGGEKLDRPTLMKVLQSGVQADEPTLIQFAREGLKALEEEDLYRQEATRFGLPGGAPAAAPAMRAPVNALPAAPAAPVNMFAGTLADIGATQPAPVNALAAPPAAAPAAAAGVTREQVQQMMTSPSARIREQGKALATTLLKEPKQPTELEVMQQLGYPLTKEGYAAFQETKKPRAPTTTINLPPQEKEERGARGKLLVKQYEGVAEAAKIAGRTLPALETQERILDSGFKTGFGTEAQKAGASVLAALGVPEANKFATDAQKFLSATQQAVLQRQLEQKGPQTEADAQRITQTGAQLGNTPDANKFIVSVAKAQLKRDIDQRNFYDTWWKKNGTYDGAEDAWFSGEGGKSLFDRPELKPYAAPAKAAPVAAPAAAATGTQPFSDAAKERRYQEWKRNQGKP